MRREERLRGRANFRRVLGERKSWANELFVMKASPNQLPINRFGLMVSKRVGKAVIRNRVKRLLREAAQLCPGGKGWDIVFIARKASAKASFHMVRGAVEQLLSEGKILAPQGEPATRDSGADKT